jgi:hypothetical protein
MRPKRLFKLLRGLVVSKLFGAASVSGAAADDIATSVWTTEAELDKEVARIFDNEAGESIDRTLDILRRKGFTCTKTERRTDYDYFCDMQETFLTVLYVIRAPIAIRASILLSELDGKLKVRSAKFVTLP